MTAMEDGTGLAHLKTWGAAVSDAASGRYTAVADDVQQPEQQREAAMLFSIAEGHISEDEDFESALQLGKKVLAMFKELGNEEGVADSLRLVVDAMRLLAGSEAELAEVVCFATTELRRFEEEGQKTGQASMLLALARVNASAKRGSRKLYEGVKQGRGAVKIYRELRDEPMEGAALLSLAELYVLVKSHQEAVGAANKALAIFQDLGDQRSEARAMHVLAQAHFERGNSESGLKYSQDAIAAWQDLGSRRQEAIELLAMSHFHLVERSGKDAVTSANEALNILEELQDTKRIMVATRYVVQGHVVSKESEEALQVMVAAAERWHNTGNAEREIDMLELQSQTHLDLDSPDLAIPFAEHAVGLAQKAGDRCAEGRALQLLAHVQQERQEYAKALEAANQAVTIFNDLGDCISEGTARHVAVFPYLWSNKLGEALDNAKKSRQLFREAGQRFYEGRALLVTSFVHKVSSAVAEAVRDASEAQYIFQKSKLVMWEAKALHEVAQLQASRDNFPAAVRAAKKASMLVQEKGDLLNIACVMCTVAQILLYALEFEISKGPMEDPPMELIEELISSAWQAREATHHAHASEDCMDSRDLMVRIEYILAQTFVVVGHADQATLHVTEGKQLCKRYEKIHLGWQPPETGQIFGLVLHAYVGLLTRDTAIAKAEGEQAEAKSKEVNFAYGLWLCEGIFEYIEDLKEEEVGILPLASSSPPLQAMPNMPMLTNAPRVPQMAAPRQAPPSHEVAHMAPAAATATPSTLAKPKIEPQMVKEQIQEVAVNLMGDDGIHPDTPLMDAGLDSLSMVEFRNELLKEFPGVTLPGALLFDYPTVNALRDYIHDALVNA